MSENALGSLFTRMANSIRGGLGEIGKMKPTTFPDRVDEIVALLQSAGSGSGDSTDGEASGSPLSFASGDFTPAADRTRMTIEHGLGVMPDFVMVYMFGLAGTFDSTEALVDANPTLVAWGFRSAFDTEPLSGLNMPGWGFTNQYYGIDNMPADAQANGHIYCPNDTVFQVGKEGGDGAVGLIGGQRYSWVAVSGIGSGTADPVLEPLNVTENGTYEPPEGVDGYNPVTVNVDPTKITILKEQEIVGFVLDEDFGYIKNEIPPSFSVVEGEKYYVVWDGTTYETTALDASSFSEGALFLGNGTMIGLPGNNEPFAIGYMENAAMYTAFTDNAESHTVGIYQKAVQEIKLQDKTVTENGEYTADEGFDGLGKVLVEIAGAVGGNFKFKSGYNQASSSTGATFNHYCGVVPDIIIITPSVFQNDYFTFAIGYSKAMIEKTSGKLESTVSVKTTTATVGGIDGNGFDAEEVSEAYAEQGGIRNVNATSFTFGGTTGKLSTTSYYHYYILYGLTGSE